MTPPRLTRAGLLRAAAGGGAAIAGGAVLGARTGSASLASTATTPTPAMDMQILNLFLLLERMQAAFYGEAVESGRLQGQLLAFAQQVGRQEDEHVAFLATRLGAHAAKPPATSFGTALGTPEDFRATAVELEEAAVAAYLGQGANLTTAEVAAVAPLVSVEARQAAWVRDLAGISPAPHAADPARKAAAVLAGLRQKGYLG
jgi:Ferritin-like domain